MKFQTDKTWISPNFDARKGGAAPCMIIFHYTGMKTVEDALKRLCDPAAKVSAHYVVEEEGRVHALVDEKDRAWHAGVSYWRGEADINSHSIGIEIVNPGHEFGYRAFPDAQIMAVIKLCQGIISRYNIAPENILGHSDIAPSRKIDPGELFPWQKLAERGVGKWFGENEIPQDFDALIKFLIEYGYNPGEKKEDLTRAFHRHFAPEKLST
ncbi:MAG: N-acetylmuramoyl-L-alanine amidase [Alphaproteobacteria bacterium]